MTNRLGMNRRQFVVSTAAVGGGMALGVNWQGGIVGANAADGDVDFGAFLVIGADDKVTVRVPSANVGNSARTQVSMMVCEELQCDWTKVQSSGLSATRNLLDKGVYTSLYGNAKSVVRERDRLLQAGASARERLRTAAAQQWNVPLAEIEAKDSKLIHKPTGRSLRFGEVAAKAAAIKLDAEPQIKPMDKWTVLGTAHAKIEALGMVNGTAKYGIDAVVPGTLYAAIRQAPVHGATLKSFDANALKDRPGIVKVVAIGGPGTDKSTADTVNSKLRSAVAVVAEHFYQAKSALDILPIEWDEGAAGKVNNEDIRKQYLAKLDEPGKQDKKVGDAPAAMKTAYRTVEAIYETPYIDHALMEPINGMALVTPDRVDIWGAVKLAPTAQKVAAEETGIPQSKVFVNTDDTYLGGDFGRRHYADETRAAVAIAMQVPGRPVKVIWTREETMRQGRYRPLAISKFQAGIDRDGNLLSWTNRHVGGSLASLGPDFDYIIPNVLVEHHPLDSHLVSGPYRGPGHNQNPFKVESFMDEVAQAGGKDPLELRRQLLKDVKDPGWLKSLNEVAQKAQWGKPLPKGRAQGFAIYQRAATQTAEIAEVSVSQGGEVRVHTVDVAFDCGVAMNPNVVASQYEGGIMFGVSDTLYSELTVRNGRVVEGNFDDYRMMRMDEAPLVRIHWGGLTGGNKLTPVGEQPNGAVSPAICNAIFRATGKRIRSLPLKNHDLSWT